MAVVNVELGHLHLSTDPAHSGRDAAPHNQTACAAVGLTGPIPRPFIKNYLGMGL